MVPVGEDELSLMPTDQLLDMGVQVVDYGVKLVVGQLNLGRG